MDRKSISTSQTLTHIQLETLFSFSRQSVALAGDIHRPRKGPQLR